MKEKKRVVVLAIGTFFLFSLLIVQYFKIQILEGERWTKEALAQHECVIKEPFRRGTFFSNTSLKKGHPEKPQPLVFDVTKYHLFVDPVAIPEMYRTEIVQRVTAATGLEMGLIRAEFERRSRSRKIAMWLTRDNKEQLQKWWVSYARARKIPRNALFFVTDYQRSYPFGKLLGQVLHTIREVKEETTQAGVPTGGLEAYFNEYLKGKQGKRIILRSPLNSLETDKIVELPLDGADIYLTINHCIQAIAEEELEKGVIAANAKGGWAVMMDPFTGEILAFAQYPFFEPARYRDFFNDPGRMEDAKVKPVTDAFELGSIMKPITFAVCLKANEELAKQGKPPLFDPCQPIDTTRSSFPGRGSKPLKDPSFHRKLNMRMALQKSSNVYMAQIIDRVIATLGNEWYRDVLVHTFGFGEKTGIELPGEAVGLVPTPGKTHPNGALEWSLPTPYSLSMGYNLMATSLQMLRAYAVLANGGKLIQPTLVKKIARTLSDGREEIIYDFFSSEKPQRFPQVLSKESIHEVVAAMKYITKPGGTAKEAEISGYTEAGKSGTAEKLIGEAYSKQINVASFIGFTPANFDPAIQPRFVLIVTVDEPQVKILENGVKAHHGGRCSAAIFREIARRTLEYLGIEPDDPYGYPAGDPRYHADRADWMKEVRDLKLLYEQWNKPR